MMTTMDSMTTIDLASVDASAASAPETSIDQIHIETTEERFLSEIFVSFSIYFLSRVWYDIHEQYSNINSTEELSRLDSIHVPCNSA